MDMIFSIISPGKVLLYLAPYHWYDTVGAILLTSVLDFDKRS